MIRVLFIIGLLISPGAESAWLSPGITRAVSRALPHPARLEIGQIAVREMPPADAEVQLLTRRPVGLVSLQWRWEEKGRRREAQGTAVVRAFAPVAVTTQPIRDGDALVVPAVRFEEREIGPLYAGGYFTDESQLAPLRARGYVAPGTVLLAPHTEQPVLVQPGQMVQMVRQRGGLRVSAQVEALQRGRSAEWIRVRNPSTRKTLQARVDGPGTVSLP